MEHTTSRISGAIPEQRMIFFVVLIHFFGTFLLSFIIKFVFYHFYFFFWWSIKFSQQFISQSKTGIGDKNLPVKLYEHDNFRNPWRCRTLTAISTQKRNKYYYKKEVLHNSKTFSSLFLDLNIFALSKCHKMDEILFIIFKSIN